MRAYCTVGKVKDALLKAGVKRGIAAPIAYLDDSDHSDFKVFTEGKNILQPHLIKSAAFDYEKEGRFAFFCPA